MKKTVYCMMLLLFVVNNTFSQVTLTYNNNAYLESDSHPFILTNNVSEGESGANQVWDFSKLTQTGEITSYMLSSKKLSQSALYPTSNIVLRENGMDYYFLVTPSGMEEYGNSGERYSIVYDKPIVKFPFPFTYGSSCSGTYSGKTYGSITSNISGTYSSVADGYGSLLLPGDVKINDVLRVKFLRTLDNAADESVTYRWYAKNSDPVVRYPLLSITATKVGDSIKVFRVAYYAYADQLAVSGIADTIKAEEYTSGWAGIYQMKLSPNPFVEKAKIEYSLPQTAHVNIQVFDNLGRLVELLADTKQAAGDYSIPFEGRGQFVYFVRFTVNGEVICSKKLIQAK